MKEASMLGKQALRPLVWALCITFPFLVQAIVSPSPAQAAAASFCVSDDTTLCLLDGRVQVRARWRNQHDGGTTGTGRVLSGTEKTGLFWFFSDDNTELIVKVLDGTQLNGSLWFFLGALTDVEFWVDVTDTMSGQTRTYYNPPGNTFGLVDTSAFSENGVGNTCGGIAGEICPGGLHCDLPAGQCQGADLQGTCVEVFEFCPEIFAPVCGCDGQTYSNDCFRLLARVARDHDGACDPGGPGFCGGIAGFPCPQGQVCDFDPGQCQVADLAGTCVPRGDGCLTVFDPVCGCDGKTYGNDCERLLVGVPKDHDGECQASPSIQ